MSKTPSWISRIPGRVWIVGAIVVWAVSFQIVRGLEPQGAESCRRVQILGVIRCRGNAGCFDVEYLDTPERRRVGTFVDKPFTVDYVGPAALFMHRGQWTGSYHFRMANSCEQQ
jgi:hypothetical protein